MYLGAFVVAVLWVVQQALSLLGFSVFVAFDSVLAWTLLSGYVLISAVYVKDVIRDGFPGRSDGNSSWIFYSVMAPVVLMEMVIGASVAVLLGHSELGLPLLFCGILFEMTLRVPETIRPWRLILVKSD